MSHYEENEYKIFELFKKNWALVTAGSPERFNTCTVSWGSLGTLWTRPGHDGQVVTVYIHPGRYTLDLLKENECFTLCFFPPEYKNALSYLGSHSGRKEDKVAAAGLTPMAVKAEAGSDTAECISFAEACCTFLCRKVYAHPFDKEAIAPDVADYYQEHPSVYPPDEQGSWRPHWIIVGEILEVQGAL